MSGINYGIKGVKVFDTILAEGGKDTTSRNSADFWKAFCNAAGWGFSYERIHSFADVQYFFSETKINEDIIIFSGHGDNEEGFRLSNGDIIDGKTELKVKKGNDKKNIIFSTCLMGKNDGMCRRIFDMFDAESLFAYRHEVQDKYCFLFESILLDAINSIEIKKQKRGFSERDFDNYISSTMFMKNMNASRDQSHPLVIVTHGNNDVDN